MLARPDRTDPEGSAALGAGPVARPRVEVRRSQRRRRTVSAYRDGDTTVVLLPDRMTAAEEERWVASMLARLGAREQRRRPSDEALMDRARVLSARHLGDRARPLSVRWSSQQERRWGSCTPGDRAIRVSTQVQGMPSWVLDYVLVHELAHLIEPRHDEQFWALVSAYPRAERARGYLEGVSAAKGQTPSDY